MVSRRKDSFELRGLTGLRAAITAFRSMKLPKYALDMFAALGTRPETTAELLEDCDFYHLTEAAWDRAAEVAQQKGSDWASKPFDNQSVGLVFELCGDGYMAFPGLKQLELGDVLDMDPQRAAAYAHLHQYRNVLGWATAGLFFSVIDTPGLKLRSLILAAGPFWVTDPECVGIDPFKDPQLRSVFSLAHSYVSCYTSHKGHAYQYQAIDNPMAAKMAQQSFSYAAIDVGAAARYLNTDVDHIVVSESHPGKPRTASKGKPKVSDLGYPPTEVFRVICPEEVEIRYPSATRGAYQGGTHRSPAGHKRRAHQRTLRSPRYTNARGKTINVGECWIGDKAWEHKGVKYKVVPPRNHQKGV